MALTRWERRHLAGSWAKPTKESGRTGFLRLDARNLRTLRLTPCRAFDIELGDEHESALTAMGVAELEALQDRLLRDRSWS
jgi:hypothetical protein